MSLGESLSTAGMIVGLSLASVATHNATTSRDAAAEQGKESRALNIDEGERTSAQSPREEIEGRHAATIDERADSFGMPAGWSTWRVAGDLFATVGRDGDAYVFGDMRVDENLPVGYPRPTPPEAVELKRYPSVRRAQVSGTGDPRGGSFRGFFPLFNHIQRNDIAMTAPVEMSLHDEAKARADEVDSGGGDVADGEGQADNASPRWTMSFLYGTADLGPTGDDPADPRVTVVDAAPVTVIAVGVRAWSGVEAVDEALAVLHGWLNDSDEWRAAGDPRTLGYNGPSTPPGLRWSEVQIPIARVANDSSGRASDEQERPGTNHRDEADVDDLMAPASP